MTAKNGKPTAQRTSSARKQKDPAIEIRKLKKQIVDLRKKLRFTERERDGLRPLANEYMKTIVAREEIEDGFDGVFIQASPIDFIKHPEKQYVEGTLDDFVKRAETERKKTRGKKA